MGSGFARSGTNSTSQSQIVVTQNQTKDEITLDTQLKTTLSATEPISLEENSE